MKTITGKKVILRPINLDDTEHIVRWRNTDFVRNNFIFREELTSEMHTDWMNTKVKKSEVVQYIICDLNLKPIGSIYYKDFDQTKKIAEFGIFIGEKEYVGRGLGQEATKLFIRFGFDKLNLKKIILRVIDKNNRASHVYEKSGFVITGKKIEISQPSGDEVNVVYMEVQNDYVV